VTVADRRPVATRRPSPATVVLLLVAAAYAGWAATTTPFTFEGDVATAIPLVVLAAAVLAQWLARDRGVPGPLRRLDPPAATTGAVWPVPAALGGLLGWELYNYFSLPRALHPTVSSLYDAAAGATAWKAVIFLAWLALGWALVRR
jgi:hypothetical protein